MIPFPHRITRNRRRPGRHRTPPLVLAPLVVLASCGGSESSGEADPDRPATTIAATSLPPLTGDGAGDADAPAPGDAIENATTVPLVPSAEADLPSAAPGATTAPTTTTPGPLPRPDISLFEIGRFDRPVEIARRPRDNRAFVVEQPGRITAADDLSSEVVLDIADLVDDGGSEQGLLGVAFHPTADLAYVHHTREGGATVVAEYAVDPDTAVFDTTSRREVLTVDQPFSNHNGGEIDFGPDELLYLGLGDGGSADDPMRTALDLGSRLGKILRIDPRADAGAAFTVPADNPFVGIDGADPTIWSYGLRNPWKFSFDSVTGDLWIADVGQNEFEEINRVAPTGDQPAGRGVSFGWSAYEANERLNDDQPADGHVGPVVAYSHDDGRCSVSGGAVARRSRVSDLNGWYVYGDYCSGTIWGYDTTSPPDEPVVVELAEFPAVAAIAEGVSGDLYVASNDGIVARIQPA